jgi:hypothetical protein
LVAGKAALLEAIGETGSIPAGRRMGMSYRRAWLLTKTMNACFCEPLIETTKGGIGGDADRTDGAGSASPDCPALDILDTGRSGQTPRPRNLGPRTPPSGPG